MELTIKELKKRIKDLPDESILCVGEDGDYISIEAMELKDEVYTNSEGYEKEGKILILKNE